MTGHATVVSTTQGTLGLREPAEVRPTLRQELVSFLAPGSTEADQYRGLRLSVERLRRTSGFQVFAVTSATAGEGKTVTTLNLAGALAQSPNARVLVIGADLHRPMLSEYFGLPQLRAPGLADLITDRNQRPEQVIRRLDSVNLSILPAGTTRISPYEVLASPRVEELLKTLRQHFDYVLVDAPPVIPCADCRLLGDRVDGFLVVVAAHRTPRTTVEEAFRLLAPARIVGVVLNGDDRPAQPYYGY
jgi:capsular exopolysaccharide synthesis family protein